MIELSNSVRARDFVDQPGLSEQDKLRHESLVDFMLTRAYAHAECMRRCPGVMRMFLDTMNWHRNIVVKNKYAHNTVDYDVYINDVSWEVAHIILTKALSAVHPYEIVPPVVRVVSQVAAIDSPYRVAIAAHPMFSGYLAGEGIAKVLQKLWVYFFMQRHKFTEAAEWHVETTTKTNDDLVAEVRLIKGRRR